MSDSEKNNIDKIFNEMMSQNSIDPHSQEYNPDFVIKELIQVQESLAESIINVNAIIYSIFTDSSYILPSSLSELIGPLFKISEDFIAHSIELSATIEDLGYEELGEDSGESE